jgi:hypothetical protein
MGGKSQPAPDYGPMKELGAEQLAFAKEQYKDLLPLAQQVATQQIAAQNQQMQQAQDYFSYQQNTFRPLEQGLVRDAERFNTDAYRENLARDASAAAGRAFGITQAASQRAQASMGVNPNSGRAMSMANQSNLGLAANRANAMTGARNQAEQIGFARRLDVTGLGRNLSGASTAAYQGATGAGSAGINTSMAPGSQYQQGLQQSGQTYGNVLNNQTSQFNTGLNAESQVYGALAGAATTAAFKFSDRRLKNNIEEVGRDERTMLPLYEFEYNGGSGQRYLGVMADDVEKRFPDMVYTMPDGYKAVNYAGLGIEMLEV